MELDYVKLKEIKPVLAGYIRESQSLLKKSIVPGEKVVHDVRVLMKKSRSILKLAGPQLGNDFFTSDIKAFREVGRIMCSWRETLVIWRTLKDLRKEFPGIFSRLQDDENLITLSKKPEPVKEPTEEVKAGLEKIDDLLNKAAYRIRFQSMNDLDPQLLIKELEISYTAVMDKYLTCRNNPKPENFHDLRKKVKDFLYQIFFFKPLNPSVVRVLEKRLDNMARNLGKFNDLSLLVKALKYNYSNGSNAPAIDELMVKIREKQDKYLEKVWPVAYKIFCPGQKLVNVLGFKLLVI